jgi:hypothetical protein
MVILWVPPGVEEDVEIVSVELKGGEPEVRLNVASAPLGIPEAYRLTVPLNPATGETVMLSVTADPGSTVPDAGLALIVKSVTVSV